MKEKKGKSKKKLKVHGMEHAIDLNRGFSGVLFHLHFMYSSERSLVYL